MSQFREEKIKVKTQVSGKGRQWLYYIVIAIFCFILYGNTISNEYSLDDNYVIYDNEQIKQGIKAIPEIFTTRYSQGKEQTYGYRPLPKATFAIEYEIFGDNPHVMHVVNILIYILIGILLFILLKRMLFRYDISLAFSAVLLFIAHPIHTEVVASLKNREEMLCFAGLLISLYFAIQYTDKHTLLSIILSVFFFICSLISKESAIVFVAVIPLTLFYINTGKTIGISSIKIKNNHEIIFLIKNPIFGIALLLFLITIFTDKFFLVYFQIPVWLSFFIHKTKSIKHGTVAFLKNKYIIITLIIFSLFTIARKSEFLPPVNNYCWRLTGLELFIIIPLIIYIFRKQNFYAQIAVTWNKISVFWKTTVLLVIILALISYVFIKGPDRLIEPTDKRLYFFENPLHFAPETPATVETAANSLWFYIKKLVFPHPLGYYYGYNMFPIKELKSPVFIISLILHFILLVYAIIKIWKKNLFAYCILFYFITILLFANIAIPINGIVGERFLFVPSFAFCILIPAMLYNFFKINIQNKLQRKKNKSYFWLLIALIIIPYSAKTIVRNNDWKDRMTLYLADAEYLDNSAKAHSMIAGEAIHLFKLISNDKGKEKEKAELLDLSAKHSLRALEIFPDFYENWNNLGTIYYVRAEYRKALECLQKTNKIRSDNATINFNIAMSYEKLHINDSAITYYYKTIAIDTANTKAYSNLAKLYLDLNMEDLAIATIRKALRNATDSEQPYLNMGTIFLLKNNPDSAAFYFEKAIEREPVNVRVCEFLINYFHKKGNAAKVEYYRSLLFKASAEVNKPKNN
ncbi:MAG: hypothetical protein HY738_21665 [Bacteroidia bacterium]|nr:hypothetical protein [Bacteroidia bacterium]